MENTMNNRNEIPQQVKQVVSIAETLLQGQILGMYLYGSATMNKLRPDSDIDILIITRQELNLSTKKELTKQLLEISGFVGCAEKRPLEITVIHQKDIIPWQFPPKCAEGRRLQTTYSPDSVPRNTKGYSIFSTRFDFQC